MAIKDREPTDAELLDVMHVIVEADIGSHGGVLGIAGRMSYFSNGNYRAAQLFVDNFIVGEGLLHQTQAVGMYKTGVWFGKHGAGSDETHPEFLRGYEDGQR